MMTKTFTWNRHYRVWTRRKQQNWDYQNGTIEDKSRQGSGCKKAAKINPGWYLLLD